MSSSTAWQYFTRIAPATSLLLPLTILVFSYLINPFGQGSEHERQGYATVWQKLLSVYVVTLHVLSLLFPVRLLLALRDITGKMALHAQQDTTKTSDAIVDSSTSAWPLFVILLPSYQESRSTMETTLRVLASHTQARMQYHVRAKRVSAD
jgi:hypothetical protein